MRLPVSLHVFEVHRDDLPYTNLQMLLRIDLLNVSKDG
jgi:hypothetical protein